MTEVSFGEWLRRRRKAAGWTQEQLAQQIGCSTSALKKIEAEDRRPSAQIVQRLADIFHIPPNEQTNFLRFARGDWKSAPAESSDELPWRVATRSPRSNIPATTTSLIGREKEIALVREYLSKDDIRLVTLIGPPGIGKTRLSIEAGRKALPDFSDGVFFIPLAPLDDPLLIASAIAQALGYVGATKISTVEQLKEGIGDKHMLLVIDNCEHLIEDVSSLASGLLSACFRLKILATSRESFRIPGEWLYPVPAFDIPEESSSVEIESASKFPALMLFAERARAVRPDFVLNADNIQTVATICAQLDGLPLAIELIAARIRLMSPQTLSQKLGDQFVLYADGMRALSARQKTLHNAIDWSYNLLSEEEQNLFTRLSVLSGGFTLEAADTIFSRTVTDTSITELITSLLDKSLLQRTWNERGEPRFNMLVTIRQFALNRLRQRNEETEVWNWHLTYFLDLAEKADKEIHGANQIEWMNRLEEEHDNFRAALDWGLASQQTEFVLRLFGALSWFRRLRGFLDEARTGFEKIRIQPDVLNYPLPYAKVLNAMGRVTWLQGDIRHAETLLNESRAIWQKWGAAGERGLAEALDFLGMVAWVRERDSNKARAFFEQGQELYRKCGDDWGLAEALFHLGIIAVNRHEDTLALSCFERSLVLFKQLSDFWAMGRVSSQLGNLFMLLGDFEKAQLILEEGLSNDRRLKFKQGIVDDLLLLASLSRYRGDYDQAAILSKEGLLLSQECDLKGVMTSALYSLGLIALKRDDYSTARQYFTDIPELIRTILDKAGAYKLLTGFAAATAGMNQPERAAKLYGAAQAIFETIDYRMLPFDRAEFDRHMRFARERLGTDRFEKLVNEGRAMTMEQAIAYALEDQE